MITQRPKGNWKWPRKDQRNTGMFEQGRTVGYFAERQKSLPVFWKGNKMNIGFRTDLITGKIVLVEIKSVL